MSTDTDSEKLEDELSGQPVREGVADAQPDDESRGPVIGAENRDAAPESRKAMPQLRRKGTARRLSRTAMRPPISEKPSPPMSTLCKLP